MTGTLAVAIYAAVVATGGLLWQIYTYRRNERVQRERESTRMEVKCRAAFVPLSPGVLRAVGIEMVNRSQHPVRVTHVWFEHQRRQGWNLPVIDFIAGSLPVVIEARDSGTLLIARDVLVTGQDAVDPTKPVTAHAGLATGEDFRAEPVVLDGVAA